MLAAWPLERLNPPVTIKHYVISIKCMTLNDCTNTLTYKYSHNHNYTSDV